MANESIQSRRGKVTIGADTVLGMGTWTWGGYSREMLDDTEFGDNTDDYIYGILRGGQFTFDGNYKKDNTQGQDILRSYMLNEINLTNIRFYVDSVNYFTPVTHVRVESIEAVDLLPSALGRVTFKLQTAGLMFNIIAFDWDGITWDGIMWETVL